MNNLLPQQQADQRSVFNTETPITLAQLPFLHYRLIFTREFGAATPAVYLVKSHVLLTQWTFTLGKYEAGGSADLS